MAGFVELFRNARIVKNLEPVKNHRGFVYIGEEKNVPQCVWYKDIALPTFLPMNIESIKCHSSDVFLCGQMKTGTTWFCEILYHLINGGKDLFNPELPGLLERIPAIPDLSGTLLNTPPPRIVRSHLSYNALPPSYREVKPKTVYLMRNPRDTCVSFYHFMKIFPKWIFDGSFDDMFEAYISGDVWCGPFTTSIRSFWENKDKLNILFVFYEDMKKDFDKEIRKIAEFLEISVDDTLVSNLRKATTLKAMRDNDSANYKEMQDPELGDFSKSDWFMRKGEVGDWKNYFSEDQVRRMDAWVDKELTPLGIRFCYELE